MSAFASTWRAPPRVLAGRRATSSLTAPSSYRFMSITSRKTGKSGLYRGLLSQDEFDELKMDDMYRKKRKHKHLQQAAEQERQMEQTARQKAEQDQRVMMDKMGRFQTRGNYNNSKYNKYNDEAHSPPRSVKSASSRSGIDSLKVNSSEDDMYKKMAMDMSNMSAFEDSFSENNAYGGRESRVIDDDHHDDIFRSREKNRAFGQRRSSSPPSSSSPSQSDTSHMAGTTSGSSSVALRGESRVMDYGTGDRNNEYVTDYYDKFGRPKHLEYAGNYRFENYTGKKLRQATNKGYLHNNQDNYSRFSRFDKDFGFSGRAGSVIMDSQDLYSEVELAALKAEYGDVDEEEFDDAKWSDLQSSLVSSASIEGLEGSEGEGAQDFDFDGEIPTATSSTSSTSSTPPLSPSASPSGVASMMEARAKLQAQDQHEEQVQFDQPPARAPTRDGDEPAVPLENQFSVSIALLGTPNAGKSSLTNYLMRQKISAVSAKRNTTQQEVLGIHTDADTQVVIYDTPGINPNHKAKQYKRELAVGALNAGSVADVIIVCIDAAKKLTEAEYEMVAKARELVEEAEGALERAQAERERQKQNTINGGDGDGDTDLGAVAESPLPVVPQLVLAMNKTDLVHPKEKLKPKTLEVNALAAFKQVFFTSARSGDGVDVLEEYVLDSAVPRPWLFEDPTQRTEMSDRELGEEIMREKIFRRLNQEIPYTVDVVRVYVCLCVCVVHSRV